MSRDPDGEPEQASPTDLDDDATQAFTPSFDTGETIQPVSPGTEVALPRWSAEELLPLVPVTAETPATETPAAEPSGLDELFAEERFTDVPDSVMPDIPLLPLLPGGTEPPAPPPGADGTAAADALEGAKLLRVLVLAALALVAILLLLGFFSLGTRLPALFAQESEPTAPTEPDPVETVPTGPVEPGVWAWDELRGGECLTDFDDAWAEEFTVVDCLEEHTAQLTYRGSFVTESRVGASTAPPPAFPGVPALTTQVAELCADPEAFGYAAARSITDGRMQGSFPVTVEAWQEEPVFYCFFTRSSGAPIPADVAP